MKLNLIYEDDELVVVEKPAGVLSIPDRYDPNTPNLQNMLRKQFGQIFTVHRLDRDTSGLILFAKNEEAHQSLSIAFEGREVQKTYLALVSGTLPEEGTIDEPIAHSLHKPGYMTVAKKGKPSVSHFKRVQDFGLFSLAEVIIETGRTHQVRVHMSYIGHPLFIDEMYGGRAAFKVSEIKGRRYKQDRNVEEERPLIDRHTLHAHKLIFVHPKSGETMEFTSELPKDMNALIRQVEKWAKK